MSQEQTTREKLHGIFPALVTPYAENGTINRSSIRKIVELNLRKGVQGFYACGSTGEAFLLTQEERKTVLEAVVESVAGRAAVIAHIGNIGTDAALSLARHAKEVGADAISSIPPFYYGFRIQEVKRYYLDLVEETGLPLLVYNFPALTGVTLDARNAGDLLEHPLIAGVKHTSMDLYQLERMKQLRRDLVVFNGYDEVFLAGLAMGADGAIGSTFNVIAGHFIAIERSYREQRMLEAARLQKEVNGFIEVLVSVGVFNGIKAVLGHLGIETGWCRRPFLPPDEAAVRRVIDAYERIAESA